VNLVLDSSAAARVARVRVLLFPIKFQLHCRFVLHRDFPLADKSGVASVAGSIVRAARFFLSQPDFCAAEFSSPFTYFGSPLPISVFPLRLHISVLLYRFRFSCSSACWSPFPSPASEELPVLLALQSEIWGSISFCLPRAYTAHSIRPVVLVLGFVFPLLRSRCASPGSGSDRLFRSQLWVL
jgi:hypothetical protein